MRMSFCLSFFIFSCMSDRGWPASIAWWDNKWASNASCFVYVGLQNASLNDNWLWLAANIGGYVRDIRRGMCMYNTVQLCLDDWWLYLSVAGWLALVCYDPFVRPSVRVSVPLLTNINLSISPRQRPFFRIYLCIGIGFWLFKIIMVLFLFLLYSTFLFFHIYQLENTRRYIVQMISHDSLTDQKRTAQLLELLISDM